MVLVCDVFEDDPPHPGQPFIYQAEFALFFSVTTVNANRSNPLKLTVTIGKYRLF